MVVLEGREIATGQQLQQLYRERIATFGIRSETLFYRNSEQHSKKLRSFACSLNQIVGVGNASVLDVGCGYGALLEFFRPGASYMGIDVVAEFIDEAKRRFPQVLFAIGDVTEQSSKSFDYCVLAGVLSSVPDAKSVLQRSLSVARRGVIFDITLEGRLPREFSDLNRWTVDQVFGMVSESGYHEVMIRDYGSPWLLFDARKREKTFDPG